MKEFLNLFVGNMGYTMFAALFVFAMIGVAINLLMHANTRDQNSPDTPVKFSFKFLLLDNWKRILLAFLLIYVSIRFTSLLFVIDVTGNNELYLFAAVIIGFIYDKLGEMLKEKSDFLKVRK
jgi:hypothetical protein